MKKYILIHFEVQKKLIVGVRTYMYQVTGPPPDPGPFLLVFYLTRCLTAARNATKRAFVCPPEQSKKDH
jgi:hypothetical protein